jgi:hypothetical protein
VFLPWKILKSPLRLVSKRSTHLQQFRSSTYLGGAHQLDGLGPLRGLGLNVVVVDFAVLGLGLLPDRRHDAEFGESDFFDKWSFAGG